eukprot:7009179-Pyramimonas_sp.AAC.1
MAHEERSWYAAVLTAIHLCRPYKQQRARQEEALKRAVQRQEQVNKKIDEAKERLIKLEAQFSFAAEWVQRRQVALDEILADAPSGADMDEEEDIPQDADGEPPR